MSTNGEIWNEETGQADPYLLKRTRQLNAATDGAERADLAYRIATAANLFPVGEIAPDALTPEQQETTEQWSLENGGDYSGVGTYYPPQNLESLLLADGHWDESWTENQP